VSKWLVKGINGFNHSFAFTFSTYPDVIRINQMNADVVQANCLGCHDMTVSEIAPNHSEALTCVTCHAGIGHRTRK
jgi:cytochrome c nitrite reductase small subunit